MSGSEQDASTRLYHEELREIEKKLGVSIDHGNKAPTNKNERFGVYGKDGEYIDDVVANGSHFTASELEEKIKRLLQKD